jgi:hypothetical protein
LGLSKKSFVTSTELKSSFHIIGTRREDDSYDEKVVSVLQRVYAENLRVGNDGYWQAEDITQEENAIIAKAIKIQECQEHVSFMLFSYFTTNTEYSNFEYFVSLYTAQQCATILC